MIELRWLRAESILCIQELLVARHGGRLGIRDLAVLDDIVARPKRLNNNGTGVTNIPTLAACYAIDILRKRPFRSGNFPLAIAVMGTFLEVCDHDINAMELDTLIAFLELWEGNKDPERFTAWVRDYAIPRTQKAANAATYVY